MQKLESKTPGSMPNSPANSGVQRMQPANTATSHPESAPNRRTAIPPTSLSSYPAARSTASSHISPQACDTIMEEESHIIPTRITSSYSSAPRRSSGGYQSHTDPSGPIVGAANLGQVTGRMRRSNSGASVDPPTGFVKKDL